VRTIRTDAAPAPVAGAPYSQAVAAAPGELVFVSGQVPVDAATGERAEDDIAVQTGLVLRNLAAILEAAGSGMEHVVRTTIYLTHLGEDFPTVNEVYREAFAGHAPARATVGVAALPLGSRVEIDAIAIIPGA
jgi:2-iminobutanoate/2-iminopropanoate deaminase